MAGCKSYPELTDSEIERAYSRGEFPSVASMEACGHVIAKCWAREYDSVEEILDEVRVEVQGMAMLLFTTMLPLLMPSIATKPTPSGLWYQSQLAVKLRRILPAALPLIVLPILVWKRNRG